MTVNKYDKMQKEMMDYILSGQIHSTLIGKIVSIDHSSKDSTVRDVEELVEYFISLVQRAEKYSKDNVKGVVI